MGLQGSAAGVLGTVRDDVGKRRARARPTAARLDRGGRLALYPARKHSDAANVFRAERKAFSFARLQRHHTPDRKQRVEHRRNHHRTRSNKNNRAGGPRPGPLRAQRDAEAARQRIFVMQKANVQRSTSNAQRRTQTEQRDVGIPLRIVFVGHVDHGKSTLIGRILHDTESLPEGKIDMVKKACAAEGMEFEFAFVLDALLEEQKQNVTIDTTEIQFKTRRRNYVIIDAPGHKEFLKNMITGASRADASVLVIAANEGVREQSRRHAYLLSLLGIKQLIVVVNKMGLADFSEKRFSEIEKQYQKFLGDLGLEARIFVPASAKSGDNVATRSKKMKWHRGPSVLEALDLLEAQGADVDLPLRFCVQDVYRFDERRIVAGRVETGKLRIGDELVFSPANKTSRVQTIEEWGDKSSGKAIAGD